MMEDKENEFLPAEPVQEEVLAGQKAKDIDGNDVDDNDFSFVQQDKKISDVKFTTKPTTFMRDAMRRFRKNKSSVVGGIILGVLFFFAILLPINGVLPYDIENTHNYETNLPMKINPAGSGFWDGTRDFINTPYPYEKNENGEEVYIGEYADDSVIVDIWNIHEGYQNGSSSRGKGGYARIAKKSGEGIGMMFSKSYTYKKSNIYNVKFTLGWNEKEEDQGFVRPEYALFIRTTDSAGNVINLPITEMTDEYGELSEIQNEYATIASYPTVEINNIYGLINEKVAAGDIAQSDLNKGFSIGLMFNADPEYKTALYVKDFQITTNDVTERAPMNLRSFGVNGAKVADANALVQLDRESESYWAAVTDERFDSYDTAITSCNIRYDFYQITYGWRNDVSPIAQSVFQDWIDKGYIDYASVADITVGDLKITEAGQASGEVYVRSIEQINLGTDPNDDSITLYSFNSTVLMYKYLGYDTMPMHIFGTDGFGKDILKLVFSGLRTSLILGLIVAAINITIGVIWGSISGYFGGWTDLIMERITDVLSGIPWIVLMTVLTIKLGQTFFVFALALCLTGWIGTEATTRSQFYRYKGREYVLAARTLGAKSPRLIFRHILPNAIGTIVTSSILMIPSTIFSEATISFLGLGLQGLDSLGVILSRAQKSFSTYPYQLLIPAVIISLLMICFNLFGNGLRDAFNPSLKGSE